MKSYQFKKKSRQMGAVLQSYIALGYAKLAICQQIGWTNEASCVQGCYIDSDVSIFASLKIIDPQQRR